MATHPLFVGIEAEIRVAVEDTVLLHPFGLRDRAFSFDGRDESVQSAGVKGHRVPGLELGYEVLCQVKSSSGSTADLE